MTEMGEGGGGVDLMVYGEVGCSRSVRAKSPSESSSSWQV